MMRDAARRYLRAGLCVLPAMRARKRPALRAWKEYQGRLPTEAEIEAWFANGHDGLCLLTGAASGNLELLDFDLGGELFEPWSRKVEAAASGLLDRLVVETSQSGGWHVVYRCEAAIGGNMKLAQRAGDDGRPVTLIETRGEGGLFLCAPTPGYELVQGDLAAPPVLSASLRETLLEAAWKLNAYWPESGASSPTVAHVGHAAPTWDRSRPGDDYSARGDVRAVLRAHGWQSCGGRCDGNEHWSRPGKPAGHTSATLKDSVFYVFSSNAAPFEPNQAYSPFAVYALLEHAGDYETAARALGQQGYGDTAPVVSDVDLSGIVAVSDDDSAIDEDVSERAADPGPTPRRLLRMPGFVSEAIDYCMEVAAYPSQAMAFCGALVMQSFLCGRKVAEPGDLRTNLYVLALASSGAGKDIPRKFCSAVMREIGEIGSLGSTFSSGEGIEDKLYVRPNRLFLSDEINDILASMRVGKESYHRNMMTRLLSLYTAASEPYPLRAKAGRNDEDLYIDQPHLTILGTVIPSNFYGTLSEQMLTNGFFARTIAIDIGKRSRGQKARGFRTLPERIVKTAQWWKNYQPSPLNDSFAHPAVVDATDRAERVFDDFREHADDQYAEAEGRANEAAMAIWARAWEQARKLALIYACSEDHQRPRIDRQGARWAIELVDHQVRRMLFMAEQYVAKNDFDALCKEFIRALRATRSGDDAWVPSWKLNRKLKWSRKQLDEVTETLHNNGEIRREVHVGNHRGGWRFRLE